MVLLGFIIHFVIGSVTDVGGIGGIEVDLQNFSITTSIRGTRGGGVRGGCCCDGAIRGGGRRGLGVAGLAHWRCGEG